VQRRWHEVIVVLAFRGLIITLIGVTASITAVGWSMVENHASTGLMFMGASTLRLLFIAMGWFFFVCFASAVNLEWLRYERDFSDSWFIGRIGAHAFEMLVTFRVFGISMLSLLVAPRLEDGGVFCAVCAVVLGGSIYVFWASSISYAKARLNDRQRFLPAASNVGGYATVAARKYAARANALRVVLFLLFTAFTVLTFKLWSSAGLSIAVRATTGVTVGLSLMLGLPKTTRIVEDRFGSFWWYASFHCFSPLLYNGSDKKELNWYPIAGVCTLALITWSAK
jgi:hypothetical protein